VTPVVGRHPYLQRFRSVEGLDLRRLCGLRFRFWRSGKGDACFQLDSFFQKIHSVGQHRVFEADEVTLPSGCVPHMRRG
jgi:hypothetical protein